MTRSGRRIVIAGALYVGLTALTKVVGLAREFLLLSEVGVGRHLDQFLLMFGLPNMLAAFVAPVVYYAAVRRTSRLSAAIAEQTTDAGAETARRALADQLRRWGGESLVVGALLFLVAVATNLGALYALYPTSSIDTAAVLVAVFCAVVVLFSINAEYNSGITTALGHVGPLVWCNVIINIPIVIYVLAFDVDIVQYTLVLALSFVARSIYLIFVIWKKTGTLPLPNLKSLHYKNPDEYDWRVIYGSAITAASVFVFVAMRAITSTLPENSTTYYYYSLKIFDLYNTTLWFVAGTMFLSTIQRMELPRIKKLANRLLLMNVGFMILAIVALAGLLAVLDQLPFQDILARYKAPEILWLSMFAMPLLVFGPMLDLFQKICATFAWHGRALAVAMAMTAGSLICAAIGVSLLNSVEGALIGTSCGFGLGLLMALIILRNARS